MGCNFSSSYLAGAMTPVTAVPLSMAMWTYKIGTASLGSLFVGNSGSDADHFAMWQDSNEIAKFRADDPGGDTDASGPSAVTVNTWHHQGAVAASATSRYSYLDGIPGSESTASRTPTAGNIDVLCIGNWLRSGNLYWDGHLAEFGLWNIGLNDHDFWRLGPGREAPPLVRPEHLVFYRSLRWPHHDNDWDLNLTTCPLLDRQTPLTMTGTVASAPHPIGIQYPSRSRIVTLSAGVAVTAHAGPLVGGYRLKSKLQGLVA